MLKYLPLYALIYHFLAVSNPFLFVAAADADEVRRGRHRARDNYKNSKTNTNSHSSSSSSGGGGVGWVAPVDPFSADCAPSAGFVWSRGLTLPIVAKMVTQVGT